MLGKPLDFKLVPLPLAISALASVSGHPDWLSLEDIDLLLHQHTLSAAIDECLIPTDYHYGPLHPGLGPRSLLKLAPCR